MKVVASRWGAAGAVPAVMVVPVSCSDGLSCDCGSASDSVYRRCQWTFQSQQTRVLSRVMAAMNGFLRSAAFYVLLLVELSACQLAQDFVDIHIASLQSVSEITTIIQSGEAPFLTGEEPPPHSGELKHALSQAGGPTQSQLSRPMSSGHHISMEHRPRRKQLNSDTNASNKKYLKEIQQKRKEETFFFRKNEQGK